MAAAPSLSIYTRALVTSVMASCGLALFIEALALSRRLQDLAPMIERTLDRLHVKNAGARARGSVRNAHGWLHDADPALRACCSWALVPLLDNNAFDTPAMVSPRLFAVITHTPASRTSS